MRLAVGVLLVVSLIGCDSEQTSPQPSVARSTRVESPAPTSSAEPSLPPASVKDGFVTFRVPPVKVGDRFKRSIHQVTDTDLKQPSPSHPEAGKGKEHTDETILLVVEVLEVKDGKMVRAKISYAAENEKRNPTTGKSYLASRSDDDKVTVTTDSGGALPAAESAVNEDAQDLLDRRLDGVLASRPRAVGEAMPDYAEAIGRKLIRAHSFASNKLFLREATVTGTAKAEDRVVATITFKLRVDSDDKALAMTSEFGGTRHVFIDDPIASDEDVSGKARFGVSVVGTIEYHTVVRTERLP